MRTRIGLLAALWITCCVQPLQVFSEVDSGTPPPPQDVTSVAAAETHSCAIQQGTLYCWGGNTYGQLGTGDLQPRVSPARVGAELDWLEVQTGDHSTCARKRSGSVWCWGDDTEGQLGLGGVGPRPLPTQVPLGFTAQSLSLHFEHACVVAADQGLWCWGSNIEGQLGLGDPNPSADHPSAVHVAAGTSWRAIDTGQGHTCGIQTDGSLWCWGRNSTGHLGVGAGTPIQIRTPTRVGAATNWSTIRATQNSSCALTGDAGLWCWGMSYLAPIGTLQRDVPTHLDAGNDWAQLAIETFDICALKGTGELDCWGRNDEGELGTGDTRSRYAPTPVSGLFRANAVGRFHRCAVDVDGGIFCTGENAQGQLGVGDTSRRSVLTPVVFPP